MSEKLLRKFLKEEIISLQGKDYQVPAKKAADVVDALSSMGIEEYDPLSQPDKEGFANETHWKNWVKSVTGIISDDKLNKLYFKLYELGSASQTTRFVDTVLDMLYDANPESLASDLFSVPSISSKVEIPASLLPIAQINTVTGGGNKANEIGKGELAIPLLFVDAAGEYGNALYDLQVSGQNWHCKSISTLNADVRSSKLLGDIGSKATSQYGSSKGEFGAGRAQKVVPDLAKLMSMPADSSESEVLLQFQDVLNDEYRAQLQNEAGVIFYVESENALYFRDKDEVIVNRITANQPSIGMGVGSPGGYAKLAGSLNESLARIFVKQVLLEELTKADKKEIDKLIKKGIEKDRAEQKKLIQKELEAELKKSLGQSFFRQPGKIRKTIQDVCRQELAKEMQKGSDLEKSVVAVTKKVLSAWHELLYKQQHIIQRVKI